MIVLRLNARMEEIVKMGSMSTLVTVKEDIQDNFVKQVRQRHNYYLADHSFERSY